MLQPHFNITISFLHHTFEFGVGLEYLHSLATPLLHMHFRTSNVLVDENLTVKVSDYGLSKLVSEDLFYASSSAIDCFVDPEYAN